ncbi:hypothetical protein [Streptomyces sp. NPDC048508]|uniref:hypothetical protein n=1 Tax=Streptomyces sp. NPDC048508 TaxID=3365561 RepID=UPI0037235D31
MLDVYQHNLVFLQGLQLPLQGLEVGPHLRLIFGIAIEVGCDLGDVLRSQFGCVGLNFRHWLGPSVVCGNGVESGNFLLEEKCPGFVQLLEIVRKSATECSSRGGSRVFHWLKQDPV